MHSVLSQKYTLVILKITDATHFAIYFIFGRRRMQVFDMKKVIQQNEIYTLYQL